MNKPVSGIQKRIWHASEDCQSTKAKEIKIFVAIIEWHQLAGIAFKAEELWRQSLLNLSSPTLEHTARQC